MDVFCIGLIFSRDQYRYHSYAHQYVAVLLKLQKQVALFSPNWIEMNNYLLTHFKEHSNRIHCFPIEDSQTLSPKTNLSFLWRFLKLSRRLHQAESSMRTKIDLVLFAPVDDWIKPKFGKKWMDWAFPFKWTGLLTQMEPYEKDGLKLNVDPKFGEPDYLFTSKNCVGVCTLDRFNFDNLRSRVYKKVVVMPDISDLELPKQKQKVSEQIKKMAKDRMVIGTILLEDENPENFLHLANNAGKEDYFFVCAGRIEPENLSENSRVALSNLLSSGKDNIFFLLHELENSEQINDLFLTFDVCYLNDGTMTLPHPLLTKAAHFGKPVLGSKNDMVGKLVSAFETGIAINGHLSESLQALTILRMQMPLNQNFNVKKLKNYAQLQNQATLKDALEELILF
jgi:glycosyltransferase involved in cell wall biosynthesis